MNVYQLNSDLDHYQNLTVTDEVHHYINQHFLHRTPLKDSWKPLQVSVLQFKRGKVDYGALPPNDFPMVGGMPIFSKRAVDSLGDMLSENGEVLPLLFEGKKNVYFAFNPLRLVDALNEEHSQLVRFEDGRVMLVERYEFQPDRLNRYVLFKIPQETARIYVTDEFVNRVKETSLTGFLFRHLWSNS
jgi:hypothetical protein